MAAASQPTSLKPRRRARDYVFYTLLGLTAGLVLFYTSAGEKPRSLGGLAVFSVLSQSMQSVYPQGSLILVHHVDPATLKVGNDVTYIREDGETVTHRITAITEDIDGKGNRGFTTQGVENPSPDAKPVYAPNVIGKVVFYCPYLGHVVQLMRAHLILFIALCVGALALAELLRVALAPARPAPRRAIA
ncbi:MAG: signal peptidase I [Propionibacteriaceae bacterium]|jgi:signal peptidase|nr:signal peptidase I [Propionibacteriaceae bacterium]